MTEELLPELDDHDAKRGPAADHATAAAEQALVESRRTNAEYQAAKRVHKAEWSKTKV